MEGRRKCDGTWTELDTHKKEPFNQLLIKSFSIQCTEKLDAITLIQTDVNTSNDNYLLLNGFDIYGKVYKSLR